MSEIKEKKIGYDVEKGAVYFILVHGVIKFGGTLFLINLVIDLVFNSKYMQEFGYVKTINESAVMYAVGGFIFGVILWVWGFLSGKTKKNQGK